MMTEHTVCGLLIEATHEVLWPRLGRWLSTHVSPLKYRIGAGKATYFRASAGSNLIVFGRKMIGSKLSGEKHRWLSCKEITQRNYFGGDDSLLNVFTHTACHEFAHLIQTHKNGRKYGSVHNVAFYRILDDIHASGIADDVREFLRRRLQQHHITLLEQTPPVQRAAPTLPALKRGQIIEFEHEGCLTEAVVLRVNAKTVSAKPKNASSELAYWRIPYQLITAVKS